jgi:FkbM family methyltransferase
LLGELIIPFEPNPVASRVLRINCALNGCNNLDMTLLDIALGAAESRLKPITPQADNLGHTIFEVEEGAGTLCLPGDTMFADRPVGLIKLDVEGMELEILAGLSQTLRRWRPTIFVEVWDEKRAQFMEWREQSGYLISTNFRRYRNIDNFLLYHKSGQNPLA